MKKSFITITLISSLTISQVHPVTRTECRLKSAAAGIAGGTAMAAIITALGFYNRGNQNSNRGPLVGLAGVGVGIASATLIYFLMMAYLEKDTPEYILEEIDRLLEELKKSSSQAQSDDKYVSVEMAVRLEKQVASALKKLKAAYNDAKDAGLIQKYEDLEMQAEQLIGALLLKRSELETNSMEDTLVLLTSIDKLKELLARSRQLEANINLFPPKIDRRSTLARVFELQSRILLQIAQSILASTLKGDLLLQSSSSTEEFFGCAAAKFNKPWYLILAKKSLSKDFEQLNYALNVLSEITNPKLRESASELTSQIKDLIRDVQAKTYLIVESPAYNAQIAAYEQHASNKEQVKILKEEKSLLEKRLSNEERLERVVNALQNKLEQLEQRANVLGDKIQLQRTELKSQIRSIEDDLRINYSRRHA